MNIYLNNWSDSGIEGLYNDFIPFYYSENLKNQFKAELDSIEILLASYGQDNYSGDAFVLFRKDNKLYEVNASHCSCMGLEGQWEPEETSIEELEHRVKEGSLGDDTYTGNIFANELLSVLESLRSN